MCDMAEEEFQEYLLWLEAARARARASRRARTKAEVESVGSSPTLVEVPA